jgi:DNA-3-methyladenine glycosylase II
MTSVKPPLQFSIRPVPPFRLDLTVWALRRRARNLVDRWDGTTYRRVIAINGHAAEVSVRQAGSSTVPLLVVTITPGPRSDADRRRLRRLLDRLLGLRIDMTNWYQTAARDARLRPLAEKFRGVKPPRFPTVFEALVNAFACQQLSLEAGLTLLNRLAATCGPAFDAQGDGAHAFPAPCDVALLMPEALAHDRVQPSEGPCSSRPRTCDHATRLGSRVARARRRRRDRTAAARIARRRPMDCRVRAAQRLRTSTRASR